MNALKWLFSHRTKVIGLISVTIGALATSTAIPTTWLPWFVLANGLITAWVGLFNSANPSPPQEK